MTNKSLLPTALAIAITTTLLTACSGGGGASGFVRPQPIPYSPPPMSAPEACPAPNTADCVVDGATSTSQQITGSRVSDYALIVTGGASLIVASGGSTGFHFDGGTTIDNGVLQVNAYDTLHSNVTVQAAGTLNLLGDMVGSATNHGSMFVGDTVTGDVINDGILQSGMRSQDATFARIEGSFRQTANGTLAAVVGWNEADVSTDRRYLLVTGRADIDGTLRVDRYWNWDEGDTPLPGTPVSLQVLHADGGVYGQFAQWTAPGLLITGSLRYLANDVYFDMATLSAAATMASAGAGDALTLHAAGTFDAALANAGKWATAGAKLSAIQQRFLGSVGTIQRLQDYGQATKVFDSLSGHGYASAADALLQQASLPGSDLMSRISDLQPGATPTSWATHTTTLAAGNATFRGDRAGFDQWIGNRLLLGGSFGWSQGDMRFDRAGGTARDQSPQWDVYVRHNGNAGSYLFGDVGYSSHQLDLSRQIDLGATRYTAGARQSLNVMRAYLETGKDFRIGATRLTPFGALSYAVVHGSGFVEHGSTGFELAAQPSVHQRVNAAAGLRLGTQWLSNSGRWTQWSVTAGYRQVLDARDDAHAAFLGAPQATFALDGLPHQRHTGWVQMNLSSGGKDWNWLMSYDRQAGDQALSLGAQLAF